MPPNIKSDQHSALSVVRDIMHRESQAIVAVAARLDDRIAEPLELMYNPTGRLIFTGVGKMGFIGRKAAATFCSTGTPAVFLHAGEAAHGDLGIVTKDDLVIALSNSGQTAELLNLLPYLRRFDIPLICITGNPHSELARFSRHVIDIGIPAEADFHDLAPTSSTTVTLAVCDALAITLARRRGFTAEQFAVFHPGGQLGRKLLLMTSALMHQGEEIPTASADTSLRQAIVEISRKKLGAILIVDAHGKLGGILTDGDIRRVLQNHENPLSDSVAKHMSIDPIGIDENSLAADALLIMQQRAITVLPVLSVDRAACGIIHLHDLIRAGLV